MPCIWCKGVRHDAGYVSWEALVTVCIEEREGDRIRAVRRDGPIPLFLISTATWSGVEKRYPIPPIGSTVQSIFAVIFIGNDIVGHAINFEGTKERLTDCNGLVGQNGYHLFLIRFA